MRVLASPERGLTRIGSEVTVRSTSPSWVTSAGLPWRQSDEGEGASACGASFEVEHAARRRIRSPGEIRERLAVKMEGGRKSMQKVRFEP